MRRRQFIKFSGLVTLVSLTSLLESPQAHAQSNSEKWDALSEDQKVRVQEQWEKLKAMDPDQRKRILGAYQIQKKDKGYGKISGAGENYLLKSVSDCGKIGVAISVLIQTGRIVYKDVLKPGKDSIQPRGSEFAKGFVVATNETLLCFFHFI